ncbi:hypothetical protein GGI1_07974 [Acidithiobacillus sp. GGI-221]|nr:hypothetical protein GGI1_07974 [Acidithiobacillus sp. GGI-221]
MGVVIMSKKQARALAITLAVVAAFLVLGTIPLFSKVALFLVGLIFVLAFVLLVLALIVGILVLGET